MHDFDAHRVDVICDFRQFYDIDIPLDLEGADLARLSILWTGLPRESRTARRMNPDLEWNSADYLLKNIEYWTHVAAWVNTKDAKNHRNVPKPIDSPAQAIKAKRKAKESLKYKHEVAQILGIKDE